jgi:hypothetical protein
MSSPREIEAQALLKAASQLRDVQANWAGPDGNMRKALLNNPAKLAPLIDINCNLAAGLCGRG